MVPFVRWPQCPLIHPWSQAEGRQVSAGRHLQECTLRAWSMLTIGPPQGSWDSVLHHFLKPGDMLPVMKWAVTGPASLWVCGMND
jgi:hypothetical protein